MTNTAENYHQEEYYAAKIGEIVQLCLRADPEKLKQFKAQAGIEGLLVNKKEGCISFEYAGEQGGEASVFADGSATLNGGQKKAIEVLRVSMEAGFDPIRRKGLEPESSDQEAFEWLVFASSHLGKLPSWPEPEELFHQPGALGYPIEDLPHRVKEAIAQTQKLTQCPLPMVACSLFAAGSAALQSIANVVRPECGGCFEAEIPTSVWLLISAVSGERKTTVDNVFSSVIKEHGRSATPRTFSYGEETITRVKNTWVNDVTAEGVRDRLYDMFPAIFIQSSEGARVLGGHSLRDSQRSQGLGAFNSLWDGDGNSIARAGGKQRFTPSSRGVMSISIQPDILEGLTGSDFAGSGFLCRFLVCSPESMIGSRKITRVAADIDTSAVESIKQTLRDLLEVEEFFDERGFFADFRRIVLSEGAIDLWVDVFNEIEEKQKEGGEYENIRGYASKAAEQVLRLSAVIHALEYGPTALDTPITEATLRSAVSVVLYHMNEVKRLEYAIAPGGSEARLASALETFLVERTRAGAVVVPTRDISRNGPNRVRQMEAREKAIGHLEKLGRCRRVNSGKEKGVEVNPAILKRERQ